MKLKTLWRMLKYRWVVWTTWERCENTQAVVRVLDVYEDPSKRSCVTGTTKMYLLDLGWGHSFEQDDYGPILSRKRFYRHIEPTHEINVRKPTLLEWLSLLRHPVPGAHGRPQPVISVPAGPRETAGLVF